MEKILLNRYKVLGKLGEGGMAVVWKVYDEVTKKEVALKEIKRRSDEEKLETGSRIALTPTKTRSTEAELKFSEEFRTMTKLQYPYTVKVFNYGILENGDKYITMEIVEGDNLKDILKKRKLNFQEIYKILIQLTQTLNFIHSRLYVHRDIKSDNIIITKDGNIKLMDFGLMDRLGVTSDGIITGTIQYIPPEVLKGGIINESSDLYSLGILGYELVTGNPPFHGKSTIDVVRMHIKTSPKPLVEIRSDAPPEFEKIIFKLLEKEQSNRYQTAPEVIKDLSKLSKEEITAETFEQKKSYLYCSKLIGREEVIKELIDLFEKAKEGKRQSVFITAPAGIGKSRLLQEFKLEVQLAKVPYLEGFCVEQGMSTYQPFREAFKPILPMIKKEITDKYGSVLVKVLPELEKKGYKPAPMLEELGEKARIFENVTGWLKEVSKDNPLVICIEDLHWSDAASLDLLNACIRELNESPVMILAAFRDDEVEETSPIFYTTEEEVTQLVKLTPLNQDNVRSLIKTMLGRIELTDDFSEQIFNVTGGNPFFVTETIRILIEEEKIKMEHGIWTIPENIRELELPTSIEATITRRLELLSQEAFYFIQIASVTGKELELTFLEEMSNLEDNKLFDFLDELVEKQFIIREKRRYVFIHDYVREILYNQLDEDKRRKLHEKVGNILEERNIDNIEAVAILLSYHFDNGIDKQKAVKYLLMAAEELFQKASFVEAIDKYARALSILETIDYPNKEQVVFEARTKIINCNAYAVRPEVCIDCSEKIFETFYNLAGGKENLIKKIKIMRFMMKLINLLPGKIPDKIKNKLMKEYPPYTIPKRKDYMHILTKLIETSFWHAGAFFFLGQYAKALEYLEDVEKNYLPEKHGSLPYACLLAARQVVFCGTGRYGRGKQEMAEAIPVFEKYVSKLNRLQLFLYTSASFWYNNHVVCSGGKKFVEKHKQKVVELSEEYNFVDWLGWQAISEHAMECIHGRVRECEAKYTKVCDLSKKMGKPFGLETWIYAWRSLYCMRVGAFNQAQKAVSIIRRIEKQEVGAQLGYAQLVECLLLVENGKIEEALPKLEEVTELHRKYDLMPFGETLYEMAMLYIRLDRLKDAAPLLEELRERVTSEDYCNYNHQAMCFRAMGQLSLKEKDYEQAKKYLYESLEVAQEQSNELQEGLTYWALGEYYVELTQYNQAEEFLEKAVAKFKETNNEYQLKKVQAMENKLRNIKRGEGG